MQIKDDRIIRRLFEEVTGVFCHRCNLVFNFVLNPAAVASEIHDFIIIIVSCYMKANKKTVVHDQ